DALGIPADVFEEMQAASGDEVEMAVWVDEEGFTRRFSLPVTASFLVPRLGDELVVMQFDVSDFGEDISIELPADEDVLSL
ncbi:MAG TPA: hypothetical protein VEU29_01755, partial [Actinomycetota bacterium]|nr:hypothetical protein [Actinomycetota bacterium]